MRIFGERKLSLDDAYKRERQKEVLASHIAYPAIQNTGVKMESEWPESIPEQANKSTQSEAPSNDSVPIIKIDSRL